jgi:hypothetical protein
MKNGEEIDPGHLPTRPPESLTFTSLAEIYEKYLELFLGKEFKCPRGTRIVFERDNFFHLVKLEKSGQVVFEIKVEEPLILATIKGFGEYTINTQRAATLSWIPEILTTPHEIWE